MSRDEAREYLHGISWDIGTVGIEHYSDKDGYKMREAIEVLYSQEGKDEK